MHNDKFSNHDLRHLDWAQRDRAVSLKAMHAVAPTPRAIASSGWGTDVAGADRRSVRAYLAGKGDARMTWWNLFSWAYTKLVPGADLERAMYAFHRFHHALTLARLEFSDAVLLTAGDIERDGVLAAARSAAGRQFN